MAYTEFCMFMYRSELFACQLTPLGAAILPVPYPLAAARGDLLPIRTQLFMPVVSIYSCYGVEVYEPLQVSRNVLRSASTFY